MESKIDEEKYNKFYFKFDLKQNFSFDVNKN